VLPTGSTPVDNFCQYGLPDTVSTDADRTWILPGIGRPAAWGIWLGLGVLVVVAVALGLLVGHGSLADPALKRTFLELRAYRVATGFFIGASLAVGGVLVQGIFRNPLASPDVLGATGGASLGGKAALITYDVLLGGSAGSLGVAPEMVLPIGCMVGALFALALLLLITRWKRDRIVLLLAGFLISSLCLSVSAFLTTIAQESWELGRAVVRFTLGDVSGSGPRQLRLIVPIALFGGVAAWLWGRSLDVMLSGEEEAESLGVDTAEARRYAVAWTALLSAGAVAVGGNVGFVGLVVPHVLRSLLGVGHRRLVPAAAVGGGVFVVLCDVVARLSPGQGELPLGVVTGLVGAPVFLVLLVREARR
jgi:iron complex transport system permease protein